MFCKYCGKRIESPAVPCPHCGSTQGELQSTCGYFGILKKMDEVRASGSTMKAGMGFADAKASSERMNLEVENSRLNQNLQKQSARISHLEEQLRKMKLILIAVASGAFVVLLLVIILFSVLLSKAKNAGDDNDRRRPQVSNQREIKDSDEETSVTNVDSEQELTAPDEEGTGDLGEKAVVETGEQAVAETSEEAKVESSGEAEAETSEAKTEESLEETTEETDERSDEDASEESDEENSEESDGKTGIGILDSILGGSDR